MAATSHAILGASSATRWMSCPGSVREIAALPESEQNRTSVYADEGTAAHTLAEQCLTNGLDPNTLLGVMIKGELQEWEVTDEMADAVQVYLDEVERHVARFGNAVVEVERGVQPLDRDDMWGTADVIIHEPFGELVVIDFKYGRGIVVETDWNDQMMFYALGALREVGADDVSKVTIVVVQPRAFHVDGGVRPWTVQTSVLLEFADQLSSAAEATKDPNAVLHAGPWCSRHFCPVAATCPALRALVHQTARDDFNDLPEEIETEEDKRALLQLPDSQDPGQLARAMQLVPLLDFWMKEVQSLVHHRLEYGQEVPGFKLVRTSSNRQWRDADDLERRLRNMKDVRVDDIFTRKVKSPAQIEKLKVLGAKPADRKAWVAQHAVKPEGKLVVARESDPREAAAPPIPADFASPIEDSPASGSRTEGQN